MYIVIFTSCQSVSEAFSLFLKRVQNTENLQRDKFTLNPKYLSTSYTGALSYILCETAFTAYLVH